MCRARGWGICTLLLLYVRLTQEKHTQDDGTGVPEHTVRITEQLLLLRGVL